MKLLIGGSPCTHWSIAQTKNRETEPEGLGWELFKNYLIALEKFRPDYFLHENNKSMATETDKYAIRTTQRNFPDTIQLGDAFQVRDDGWRLPGLTVETVSKPEREEPRTGKRRPEGDLYPVQMKIGFERTVMI